MYKLQELLESAPQDISPDSHLLHEPDDIERKISDAVQEIAGNTSGIVLKAIKRDAQTGQASRRKLQKQFEKKLRRHWKKPLDLLHLLIELAREAGADFNGEFRDKAVEEGDDVFEALTRLHARACQTASEVLTLLESGYADGAHARWRSLHEISVVSNFIEENGQGIAEKYLDHEVVQRFKLGESIQKHHEAIGIAPIPEHEIDALRVQRDELVATYGKDFEGDYGWAGSAFPNKKPTFRDIEQSVNLDHWRPYYKMASDNEHPNAHGLYFRLGLNVWHEDVLLAGPSSLGLAGPGHSTAISLNVVTTTLLATESSLDCVVVMNILSQLVDEIGEEFLKAHQAAEAITEIHAK